MTTKGCLLNFSEQENVVSVKREGILKLLSSLVTNTVKLCSFGNGQLWRDKREIGRILNVFLYDNYMQNIAKIRFDKYM